MISSVCFFHYAENLEITVSPFSVHVRFRTGFWERLLTVCYPRLRLRNGQR